MLRFYRADLPRALPATPLKPDGASCSFLQREARVADTDSGRGLLFAALA